MLNGSRKKPTASLANQTSNQTSIFSVKRKSLLLMCLVLNKWKVLIIVTLHIDNVKHYYAFMEKSYTQAQIQNNH